MFIRVFVVQHVYNDLQQAVMDEHPVIVETSAAAPLNRTEVRSLSCSNSDQVQVSIVECFVDLTDC